MKLRKDQRVTKMARDFKYENPLGGYTYIGWNQRRKVNEKDEPTRFADKRVRQAMTYLVDRERIARDVYLGYARVASGPFNPDTPQADPNIKPYPYDEAKGKSLLAAAGYTDRNNDGVIDRQNLVGHWLFEDSPGIFKDSAGHQKDLAKRLPSAASPAKSSSDANLVDLCHVLLNSNEFLHLP